MQKKPNKGGFSRSRGSPPGVGTLLKRLREKEQLSDQWNLGNPSVPDRKLSLDNTQGFMLHSATTKSRRPHINRTRGLQHFPVDKRNGDKKKDFSCWSAVSLTLLIPQNEAPSTFSEAVPHFILLKSTDFLKSLCNKTNPCSECTKYLLFSGFFYSSCWVRWQKSVLQQPSLNRIPI